MKQKPYLLIALLAMMVQMAVASPVSLETAKNVGLRFLCENTQMKGLQSDDLQLVTTYRTENGTAAIYVFNAGNGFVMVSADDCAIPILGYSNESIFTVDDVPIQMEEYLQHFVEQIQYGIESRMVADERTARQWELVQTTGNIAEIKGVSVVTPLLTDTWNQNCYYNNLCPVDANGPCGHVYAGCAATAFSQILHYWGFPSQGTGSHSYTPEGYPTQTANFGATTYQWSNMPNALTASSSATQINAVATLMWHCGVAINMSYGPNGSSAFPSNVANALTSYFNYSSDLSVVYKANYNNSTWLNLIKSCLDLGRPIHYSGWNANSSSGHSFVCDGYDANNMLHFNWGWSGYYNNYYALDALTPGDDNFSYDNLAIINIHPNLPSYQVTLSPNPSNAGTVAFSNKGDRETFTYDFENNSLSGWTTIDADGDGQSWDLATTVMGTGYGHNGSGDMVLSKSYDNNLGALTPDNFLVSPSKAAYSSISFYACAQDNAWPAEHFGVAVSTTTAAASAFTMVQEWTMTAKGQGAPAPGRGGDRAQGNWYQYTVDLSSYSGQPIWVAIRHFNCSDLFYLDVDDITLTTGGGGGGSSISAFFEQGQSCTVTATPNSGYYFANWTENGSVVSNSATYTFTVTDARNLVANFTTQPAPQQYTITISANPSNGGSVSFNSKGGTDPDGVADGQWYYYDNGVNTDAIGTSGGNFWWGIMLPSGSYTGNTLTKVAAYDYMAMTGTASIYQGGTNAPAGAALGTVNVTFTGSSQFVEFTFSNPVTINPQQNVWVVFYNGSGATYPAAVCANTGDANGRWVSLDGSTWEDLTSYGMDYTFMVRAYIEQGGSGGSSAVYTEGQTCTVVATPNSGYTFAGWKENGTTVSTNASYSFTVTSNRNLVAHFTASQPQQYTVTVSANPSNGGNVNGGGTYNQGASCTVTATPHSGYTFTNWTENGSVVSNSASYTFTVNNNRNLVANCTATPPPPQQYTITVTANPTNGGTVTGGGTYQEGATCVLTASPNTGFVFSNWTKNGTVVSNNPVFSFTVTENASYVAQFIVQTNNFTITALADPTEGGVVSGGGTYEQGAVCSLSAAANTGYQFVNWTKNGTVVSSNATFSFNVTENATYIAHFTLLNHYITVSANPAEGGVVTGGGTYSHGDVATVTVIPNANYEFLNWTENGQVVSEDISYSFTVTSNRMLVAQLSFVDGVEEQNALKVSVFPNPANDRIYVECEQQIVRYELFTLTGLQMGSFEVDATKVEIPLGSLPSGVYLLRLTTAEQILNRRIVKE